MPSRELRFILLEHQTVWTSHVLEYKSPSVLREEVGQLELRLKSARSLEMSAAMSPCGSTDENKSHTVMPNAALHAWQSCHHTYSSPEETLNIHLLMYARGELV